MLEHLKGQGYRIKIGEHALDRWYQHSARPEKRAKDINNMFGDEEVDAIVCFTGGFSSVQLLPYLDFNKIKKNPKPFVGMSDVSVLLNAIYKKTGVITFHGPLVMYGLADIGEDSDYPIKGEITTKSFLDTLGKGKKFNFSEYGFKDKEIIFLKAGEGRGEGFGGNISSLMSILGTGYYPETTDSIFFWEAVEDLHLVEERLSAYKIAGAFEDLNGMVIGYTGACENTEYSKSCRDMRQMVRGLTKVYEFPVAFCPRFGHFIENLTFPIGTEYKVDSRKKSLKIIGDYLK